MANRILLQSKTVIKRFLWIDQGPDGSLYIGTSNPKVSAQKGGHFIVPTGESITVKWDDGTKIDPPIPSPKISFHPSGDIHFKGSKGFPLKVANSSTLRNLQTFLRICVVIPSDPEKYPSYTKKVSVDDMVIPIDQFEGKPFVVEIVVAPPRSDTQQLLKAFPELAFAGLTGVGIAAVFESVSMQLTLLLYRKDNFATAWAPYTYMIVADVPGEVISGGHGEQLSMG